MYESKIGANLIGTSGLVMSGCPTCEGTCAGNCSTVCGDNKCGQGSCNTGCVNDVSKGCMPCSYTCKNGAGMLSTGIVGP